MKNPRSYATQRSASKASDRRIFATILITVLLMLAAGIFGMRYAHAAGTVYTGIPAPDGNYYNAPSGGNAAVEPQYTEAEYRPTPYLCDPLPSKAAPVITPVQVYTAAYYSIKENYVWLSKICVIETGLCYSVEFSFGGILTKITPVTK